MGSNPINLTFRFLLEIAALVALGYWGWQSEQGFTRFLFTIGAPLLAAILWGTFAVPDDPSRSGKAPVPVPSIIRLLLELAIFASAVWALFATGNDRLSMILGSLVLLHYALSYDRIRWLISK